MVVRTGNCYPQMKMVSIALVTIFACRNSNEYRNVSEQRCTPCPEGKYLYNKTNFTELTACSNLPDCSGQVDYCFENINDAGTIQIRRAYPKTPHVTYYTDDNQLPTAACASTTPSDCKTDCENGGTDILGKSGLTDIYCDLCPTGKKLNPNTLRCETLIDCPPETKECLNTKTKSIPTISNKTISSRRVCL